MNYILKVNSGDIDKVVLKLSEHEERIKITNVLRSQGTIYVKTNLLAELRKIAEICEIKRNQLIPQFLIF